MSKKVIIIGIIVVLIVVVTASYLLTKNWVKDNNSTEEPEENIETTEEVVEENKDEYKNIAIDSQVAYDLFEFVPKHLQISNNKMSNDYKMFSAINALQESNAQTTNFDLEGSIFDGYKSSLVLEKVKKIFGDNSNIDKKDEYNLPIGYDSSNDSFMIFPMGLGIFDEYQVIKEVKENDKTFKLVIYAVNIVIDTEDHTTAYVATKDTFNWYNQNADEQTINNSMRKYKITGTNIEPHLIVNEYKNELPLIEYELEKLDERGTKYFVKDIKFLQ